MKNLHKKKIIRTSTVPISLNVLLKGQLAFLNQFYDTVALSGNDQNLIEVHQREKVRTIALSFQRKIAPIKDLISLVKLFFILKSEKPHIIHSITPKAGLLSMIAGYFAGVPIRIHTFTGLVFPTQTGIMQKLLIGMDKLLCRFATHICPEGQGVKNDLLQYKITKKPLHIIANGNVNGIDIHYFDKNEMDTKKLETLKLDLKITNSDFVFIFVGRLVADKGINELVAAFVKLLETQKNAKLLLVGPFENDLDPLQEETLYQIQTNNAISSVGFQEDVRPYFAIANCLTFPSYREGFPNVVLQAGAMGLPAIVTNINGCNEIILDAKNGIIVPAKNENELLNAMTKILNDENFYNHLQKNARNMIANRYQQEVVWQAVLDQYRQLENHV